MAVRADARVPSRIARLVADAVPAEAGAVQVGLVGPGGSGSGEVLAAIAERLRAAGGEVVRLTGRRLERGDDLGALADLVDLAATTPDAAGERQARGDLLRLLTERGAALLVDEAQWLDPASLRVVVGVAERAAEQDLTVVVAHRPASGDAEIAALDGALSRARPLVWLPPLDDVDVAERAALILGTGVEPALVEALHEQSAGVQAFVDQLALAASTEGRPTATAAVIEAVRAEIDQLAPTVRTVLAALSAGAALDDDLLGTVTGLAGDELGEAVEALQAAGLVVAGHDDVVPVVAAAVHELTPVAERRRFHALLAAALTERGAPPSQAAEHLAAADAQGQAAAEAYVAAGEAAMDDAPELARAWFDRAVAVGAPAHVVAARRAEAAALDGDAALALRLADSAVANDQTADRRRAQSVVAALLPARGFWRRAAGAYGSLATGDDARAEAARVLQTVASIASGTAPAAPTSHDPTTADAATPAPQPLDPGAAGVAAAAPQPLDPGAPGAGEAGPASLDRTTAGVAGRSPSSLDPGAPGAAGAGPASLDRTTAGVAGTSPSSLDPGAPGAAGAGPASLDPGAAGVAGSAPPSLDPGAAGVAGTSPSSLDPGAAGAAAGQPSLDPAAGPAGRATSSLDPGVARVQATVAPIPSGTGGAGVAGAGAPSLELEAMALCGRGLAASLGSDAAGALGPFLEAAELLESAHTRLVLPDTPHAIGATVAVALSELSAAEHLLARAVERDVGGGALRQRHRLLGGWVGMRSGRWSVAQAALDDVRNQTLAPRELLLAAAIDAGLARRSGDLARLGEAWRSAEGVLLRHPADLLSLDVFGELTIAASRLGLWDRVSAKARELGDVMRALGEPPLWLLPLRWIGLQVALATDDRDAAVRRAAEVEAVTPVNQRLRALADAAQTWVAILSGTVEPAQVAASSRGLQSLGLTWEASRLTGQAAIRSSDPSITRALLEQARDLKAALPSAEADETPATASVLSEREQMVSQYIVDGLTYKEIGAQLYISPKTVEHHVAKIRQKLGATTRAEMLAALRTQLAPT